jgi:hypothetical protein
MTKRLLAYDDFTKISTWFSYDAAKDETTLSYTGGDVDKHVEASRSLQNDEEYTRKGMKNEVLHYAHIPPSILMKWSILGVNVDDHNALFAMVNKPEYAYLKTTTLYHKAKA